MKQEHAEALKELMALCLKTMAKKGQKPSVELEVESEGENVDPPAEEQDEEFTPDKMEKLKQIRAGLLAKKG